MCRNFSQIFIGYQIWPPLCDTIGLWSQRFLSSHSSFGICVGVSVCAGLLPLNWMGGHLNILHPDPFGFVFTEFTITTIRTDAVTITVLSLSGGCRRCVSHSFHGADAAVSQFVSGKIVFFISRTQRHRHHPFDGGRRRRSRIQSPYKRAPFGTLIKRYSSGRFIAPCGSNVAKWGWSMDKEQLL